MTEPKHTQKNMRHCVICGQAFYAFPSANVVTCSSPQCRHTKATRKARTHGQSNTRLYDIWSHMKRRCKENSNALQMQYYFDRGIRVCNEWKEFVAFRDWALTHGYQDTLEIDRIDGSKGYSPENCRWADRCQQMRNTRKRKDAKTSIYKGVSLEGGVKKWRAQGHRNGSPVHIGCFLTDVDAAKAYDEWAKENYGEYAVLNFGSTDQGGVPS